MTERTEGPAADRLADLLMCAPLFLATFLGKWGLMGARGLGMPMALVALAMVVGLASRRLRFDSNVLIAYLVVVAVLGTFQIVGGGQFSPASYMLMVVLYLFYTVRLDERLGQRRDPLLYLVDIASFVAICGVVQFGAQFVLPHELVFPIEHLVPPPMLIDGYNMVIAISFGSPIYKANGIFCLEPSFFSQLLALAILVELCGRNRLSRIGLLACGMVVSYSGTGILLLALCLPFVIIARRRFDLLIYGAVFLGVVLAFADALNLDVFVRRLSEFNDSKGSSAFDRFVGGFYVLDDYLWKDLGRSLTGFGAGTYASYTARGLNSAAEMALFKVVFEYGLIGSALYVGFLIYAVCRTRAPGVLKAAAILEFFLSNFYVMTPHGIALTMLVWSYTGAQPVRRAAADDTSTTDQRPLADAQRRGWRPRAEHGPILR